MRVFAALLLLTGCGGTWREVRSDHFRVWTDLSSEDAREAATMLEQYHRALRLAFDDQVDPPTSVDVVLFRSDSAYLKHGLDNTDGMYASDGTVITSSPILLLTIAQGLGETSVARMIVAHELTHLFASFAYPRLPRWFNEGLAQYLASIRVRNGYAIRGLVDENELLQLQRMQRRSLTELFAWHDYSPVPLESRRDYSSSWFWIHYLYSEQPDRFAAWRKGLSLAKDPEGAFNEAFATVRRDQLETGFEEYVGRAAFANTGIKMPLVNPKLEEEVLAAGRADALMCALSLLNKRDDQARGECARASAVAPVLPELTLLNQRLENKYRATAELLPLARATPGLDPLIVDLLDAARRENKTPEERLQLLEELTKGRPLGAKLLVERTLLLTESVRLDDALAAAHAAEALAPWDSTAYELETFSLAALKKCAEAKQAATRALDRLPEKSTADQRSSLQKRLTTSLGGCAK